ncbi:hypothetical protein O181_094308 [Austropuccinia psidii MF-1]|uniref:Uncharacterized protein n=1 Tax=Austropuccinia psidii MF-1 TaxID=1389203 RepID=A0A9Q3J2Y0_9BASI|nr:hypothetical protein [Austropuccinia psidii MF-1]
MLFPSCAHLTLTHPHMPLHKHPHKHTTAPAPAPAPAHNTAQKPTQAHNNAQAHAYTPTPAHANATAPHPRYCAAGSTSVIRKMTIPRRRSPFMDDLVRSNPPPLHQDWLMDLFYVHVWKKAGLV